MRDPAANKGELKSLTSLRGIAAMAVVLQHFSATAQWNAAGWIPSIVPHGYMAVDFFFVLSGFIMSYTYLSGFETLGMQAYGPFLWKRVARIFPLGITMTLIILFAGALTTVLWDNPYLFIHGEVLRNGLGTAAVLNLLHLQGFFNEYNLNDPSWSISVELGAYLLFPLLIALIFHVPRWATAFYVAIGAAAIIYLGSREGGDMTARWAPFDLMRCVVEFGFGMLTYRAYRDRSAICAIGRDRWTWLVAALCVATFLIRADLLAVASFPFVVLAFALNQGLPARLLAMRVPYFLGVISFSIYLVHHIFRVPEAAILRYFHPAKFTPSEALIFAFLGSLTILPFAAAAYYGIERPGRTALNSIVRKFGRRRVPTTADATLP